MARRISTERGVDGSPGGRYELTDEGRHCTEHLSASVPSDRRMIDRGNLERQRHHQRHE